MFELPEMTVLAKQINQVMRGKVINKAGQGNTAHKFVWYNRTDEEFNALCLNKTIGKASVRGRWLFVPVEPGYVLVFGECGGKMLYHEAGAKMPKKYHFFLKFTDGSFFTLTTQMWGAMELFDAGLELERTYVKDMRPTPVDPQFTLDYFSDLITECIADKKRSVKGLLTQDQLIPGLGNAIAQDILFTARLHPRTSLAELSGKNRTDLYNAILEVVDRVTRGGGRDNEFDLFAQRGGYVRLMGSNVVGTPCKVCGTVIEKINYLGGACYVCTTCQPL